MDEDALEELLILQRGQLFLAQTNQPFQAIFDILGHAAAELSSIALAPALQSSPNRPGVSSSLLTS